MILSKPTSKLARRGLAVLSLWISASVLIVIYNRYRYGTDLDSVADLLILTVAVPVPVVSACVFVWLVGRRASIIIAVGATLVLALLTVPPYYQEKQRLAQISKEAEKHRETVEKIAAERCAHEPKAEQPGEIDEHIMCMVHESANVRREQVGH